MTLKEARESRRRREKLSETGTPALPPVEEIPLERGAVLYLRPHLATDWHERAEEARLSPEKAVGRWVADVRWPSPREKDPALAAGGWRVGYAATRDEAEALGRRLFRQGPQRGEA